MYSIKMQSNCVFFTIGEMYQLNIVCTSSLTSFCFVTLTENSIEFNLEKERTNCDCT